MNLNNMFKKKKKIIILNHLCMQCCGYFYTCLAAKDIINNAKLIPSGDNIIYLYAVLTGWPVCTSIIIIYRQVLNRYISDILLYIYIRDTCFFFDNILFYRTRESSFRDFYYILFPSRFVQVSVLDLPTHTDYTHTTIIILSLCVFTYNSLRTRELCRR